MPWSHHALSTGRSEGPRLGGATTRPCPWRSALALAGLRSGGTGSATPGRRAGRARDGAPLGSRESHGAVVAEASRDAGAARLASPWRPWHRTAHSSSGSSWLARTVESTRSQNSTVNWRRSASAGSGSTAKEAVRMEGAAGDSSSPSRPARSPPHPRPGVGYK